MDTSGRVLLNSVVQPFQPITRAARRVHNITEEMVVAAPTFPELFDDILRITAGRRVLACNAAFDRECLLADAQHHRYRAVVMARCAIWVGSLVLLIGAGKARGAVVALLRARRDRRGEPHLDPQARPTTRTPPGP